MQETRETCHILASYGVIFQCYSIVVLENLIEKLISNFDRIFIAQNVENAINYFVI